MADNGTLACSLSHRIQRVVWHLHKDDNMPVPSIATICEASIPEVIEVLAKYLEIPVSQVLKVTQAHDSSIDGSSSAEVEADLSISADSPTGVEFEDLIIRPKNQGQHANIIDDPDTAGDFTELIIDDLSYTEVEVQPEPEEGVSLLSAEVRKRRELLESYDLKPIKQNRFERLTVTSDGIYSGQINDHQEIEGYGRYYYNDGSYAEGLWKSGVLNGPGKLLKSNGSSYLGEWFSGKKNGRGRFTSGEMTYEGTFNEDAREGEGVEAWSTGLAYQGEYRHNTKTGRGKLTLSSGDTYEGEFRGNQLEGFGTYKWVNGNSYEGQWLKSEMHGKGTYTWPGGKIYEGDFVRGFKDGKGRMSYPDGQVYEGGWKKDKEHGEGVVYVPGEDLRRGTWVEGVELTPFS